MQNIKKEMKEFISIVLVLVHSKSVSTRNPNQQINKFTIMYFETCMFGSLSHLPHISENIMKL